MLFSIFLFRNFTEIILYYSDFQNQRSSVHTKGTYLIEYTHTETGITKTWEQHPRVREPNYNCTAVYVQARLGGGDWRGLERLKTIRSLSENASESAIARREDFPGASRSGPSPSGTSSRGQSHRGNRTGPRRRVIDARLRPPSRDVSRRVSPRPLRSSVRAVVVPSGERGRCSRLGGDRTVGGDRRSPFARAATRFTRRAARFRRRSPIRPIVKNARVPGRFVRKPAYGNDVVVAGVCAAISSPATVSQRELLPGGTTRWRIDRRATSYGYDGGHAATWPATRWIVISKGRDRRVFIWFFFSRFLFHVTAAAAAAAVVVIIIAVII